MHNRKLAILGSRGIPARYGGFESFAERLAVGLVELGWDVSVYCERGRADQPSTYDGVILEYVPAPRLGPLSTVLSDLIALWRARRGYDVVYMLGYGSSLFCFLPRLWGTGVWINMDGLEWKRPKWNWLAKIWLKTMELAATRTGNRLIADSDGVRVYLKQRYSRLPPISVIPYGAEVVDVPPNKQIMDKWDLKPYGYYLVVCRLEPENHILEILKGFTSSDTDTDLVVVGNHRVESPYVKSLLQFADKRIRFIGTVYDSEELQSLRYFSKGYFHGHSVGGTNPSLLEALGCGNSVLAHDNVFNREVAQDAAMYFSRWEDIPALISEVEGNAGLMETWPERARSRIRTAYSWDSVIGKYYALLDSIEKAMS